MRKGISIIEYALLISIIVVALISMQIFIKKTISHRWRESADSFGFGMQYEPGLTNK